MNNSFSRIAPVIMLFLFMGQAQAADREFTTMAGYRFSNNMRDGTTEETLKIDEGTSFGVIFNWPEKSYTQWEILYSTQSTRLSYNSNNINNKISDLDISYLQIGGTYLFEEAGPVVPFIVGTLGLTRMDPKESELDVETRFSMSFGGGVKLFVTDWIGLRLEARAYPTFISSTGSLFCSGGCVANVESDIFWQFETNAGLIIAF